MHERMSWLDQSERARDVDETLAFLESIGAPTRDWIMCYPFGGHDARLRELLAQRQCAVGLTTEVRVAAIGHDDPLQLPRIDTNDLPFSRPTRSRV